MLFPVFAIAQEFNVSAMMVGANTIKYNGTLSVTDSTYVLKSIYKGKETVEKYDVISTSNNQTYVTDGVMTHYFTTNPKSGKRKGKPYTYELYFTYDDRLNRGFIVYYLSEKK